MTPLKARLIFSLLVFGLATAPAWKAWPQETLYTFDDFSQGDLPADWRSASTHAVGRPAQWQVVFDPRAGNRVLTITYIYDSYFKVMNLLFSPMVDFRDGEIEVRMRAVSGSNDRGGGIFWRARDPDNYYALGFDPAKGSLVLFYVESAEAREIVRSSPVNAGPGWFVIRVRHVGSRIQGYLNGALLIDVSDSRFYQPGHLGVWTSSNAVSQFQYLRVRSGVPARSLAAVLGPPGITPTPVPSPTPYFTLTPSITATPVMTP